MPEACPARAALAAFSSDGLAEREMAELEAHVSACLDCAQRLDEITRARLASLSAGCLATPDFARSSPNAVKKLMERARAGITHYRPNAETAVLAQLQAPTTPGALGSFAGYEVLEVAGSGGMGVVLKAHDPTLNRVVALKLLSPTCAWDEESAARFLREARTIAAIQHDNVVVVHTAGREKGLPYLVMPFHAEGTLQHLLRRTPRLTPADVARVGIQLAHALEVTHSHGILHRDIKPSNVLLENGLERMRLADFGLAQPAGDEKRLIAGTPQYMSPEQARGEGIDARSDLFGLGALLYQLAAGRTVYSGESTQEVMQIAAEGKPAPVREVNRDVPPALAEIIDRLLASRPEDRFASATEVTVALARAASRHRRWIKRAAVSALAACLVSGAVIAALDGSGQTAIFNTLLCQYSGDPCFIRGRFGTYPELVDAVQASRAGEVIEVRYSGERIMRNFRLEGKPLTIRAAKGFTPILFATNNAQPFMLADGPLTLEGLTLMRFTKGVAFTALIGAEDAPLALLNCRLFRSTRAAANLLIRSGQLAPLADDERTFPPLITLDPGSQCFMRNCLVVGSQAAAIALRGETQEEPIRAEIENSLFAIRRVFALRSVPGFKAQLNSSASVFVSEELVDLGNADVIQSATMKWTDCVFDLSQGTFVRLYRHGNGEWLRTVNWKEANNIYAGTANFVIDRTGRRITSEAEWNALHGLATNNHITIERQLFAGVVMRANPQVSASDAHIESLQATGARLKFDPKRIGEGDPYITFRAHPEYRQWQDKVHAAIREWQQRRTSSTSSVRR